MMLFREDREFRQAILIASAQLGLAPAFVEKDYWVTQVLRSLAARFENGFVFKGGTSLSKGYGLIDRFSEDVDILVTESSGASIKQRETQLRHMTETVAEDLGLEWEQSRMPGRGSTPNRADIIKYPKLVEGLADVAAEGRGVLLETGFGPGEWPCQMVPIMPLMVTVLDMDPSEFDDTRSFTVRALKPLRTLVEKLALLHHIAVGYEQDPDAADERCGRHYHDIGRLLEDPATRNALKDRKQFERILAEMEHVSAEQYGGWTPRPDAGYGASPAFSPPADSPLRVWLQERYDDAAALMPSKIDGRWPKFPSVLKQIAQHAELL